MLDLYDPDLSAIYPLQSDFMVAFYIHADLSETVAKQTRYNLHTVHQYKDDNTGENSYIYENVPLGDCNELDINPKIKEKFERYGNVLICPMNLSIPLKGAEHSHEFQYWELSLFYHNNS